MYASESSPYDSGYDHGCDDAGRSESDKYINQPERGPSFHTNAFMDGYYAGLNACSSRGSNGGGGFEQPSQPPSSQRRGIDWNAASQIETFSLFHEGNLRLLKNDALEALCLQLLLCTRPFHTSANYKNTVTTINAPNAIIIAGPRDSTAYVLMQMRPSIVTVNK